MGCWHISIDAPLSNKVNGAVFLLLLKVHIIHLQSLLIKGHTSCLLYRSMAERGAFTKLHVSMLTAVMSLKKILSLQVVNIFPLNNVYPI